VSAIIAVPCEFENPLRALSRQTRLGRALGGACQEGHSCAPERHQDAPGGVLPVMVRFRVDVPFLDSSVLRIPTELTGDGGETYTSFEWQWKNQSALR
jgi:hypothetical protein